jgi:hypothetical protein
VPIRSLRPSRAGAATLLVGIAVAVSLTAAGCTNASPAPAPKTSAPAVSATADPTPTPVATFGPTASTKVALAHFDAVVQNLLKTDPEPHGRDVIDALVAAGFDKKAMELTPDTTTIGRNVDSIEFSVLWQNKDCLVGQVGESGYGSSSSPVLSTGKCLIGTTRPINW